VLVKEKTRKICQVKNKRLISFKVTSTPSLPSAVVISGAENGKVREIS